LRGSRIGSRSKWYRREGVSRNSISYVVDSRSRTDSGIGFVFDHTIALRSHQCPVACSANATRHGTPIKLFAGSGDPVRPGGSARVGDRPWRVS
jgi:hypothetical protein